MVGEEVFKLSAVRGSARQSHSSVSRDGAAVGEVWREESLVVVSKLTEPRRMAKKWRWFGKIIGRTETIGRGTQRAMLMGSGLKSRTDVLREMAEGLRQATGGRDGDDKASQD